MEAERARLNQFLQLSCATRRDISGGRSDLRLDCETSLWEIVLIQPDACT